MLYTTAVMEIKLLMETLKMKLYHGQVSGKKEIHLHLDSGSHLISPIPTLWKNGKKEKKENCTAPCASPWPIAQLVDRRPQYAALGFL